MEQQQPQLPPRWELSRVVQLPLIVTVLSLGATGIWRLAEVNTQFIERNSHIERLDLRIDDLEIEHRDLVDVVVRLSVADATTDQRLRSIEESIARVERALDRLAGAPAAPPGSR